MIHQTLVGRGLHELLRFARSGHSHSFSRAIEEAQALAAELNIPAEFICCDLYNLPNHLQRHFDLVCTTAGVLPWLPDLVRWGVIAGGFVKPGGHFYLREFHPLAGIFDDESPDDVPRPRYPYFHASTPMRFAKSGSYADPSADVRSVSYEWAHGLGEIVNALIGGGLRIEYLHEFPFTSYRSHPFLAAAADGRCRYANLPGGLPLMFSIKAARD